MPYFDELNTILTRYQHHVAEYDKAKWELTVEQRILDGINHIPTKSAKPQSELIDLDLVRGSSFPKPKPKHGLFKIARKAILRFVFFPLYFEWWRLQTSATLSWVFLALYSAQIVNILLYLNYFPPWLSFIASKWISYDNFVYLNATIWETASNTTDINSSSKLEVETSEILSPIVLMIVLTILHSQIIATNETEASKNDRTEFSVRRNSYLGKNRNKLRLSRYNLRRRSLQKSNSSSRCDNVGSTGSKRVLFQEQSKSWTSSNSDKDEVVDQKDEGIDSGENEMLAAQRTLTKDINQLVSQSIRNSNFQNTMDKFIAEGNASSVDEKDSSHKDDYQDNMETPTISTLRGRNIGGKLAELSNTSCGECSSNNNESTSDEDFREATMDDEDVRSKSEWTAVTTNSEDDEYEEERMHSEDEKDISETQLNDHPFAWEFQKPSMKTFSPSCASSDKISCTIWDGSEAMKADLSVLDISSTIIEKVERAKESSDYIYLGVFFSSIIALTPSLWRLNNRIEIEDFNLASLGQILYDFVDCSFGHGLKSRVIVIISVIEKLCLSLCVFFLLSVAEKTYKQRFLYAKLFSRLTSSRKARKSGIPHFRLNKVRNIKTWLSIRSYLQRRGPQRSVDSIVSGTFIAGLFLVFFLSVELLKESNRLYYLYNIEVIVWSVCLGFYLMRFMTLGSRISQKYRNLSVIITEQLNLYLKMEQKPHKKEELLVANNVLKLASELLKELDDPFKVSSFTSNPYLYNVTRLVILSAFSGVLSELLGFKLKLYKIKLK